MSRLKEILKGRLNLIYASAAAFTVGLPLGVLTYPLVEDQLPQILQEAFAGVMSGSTPEIILKVFLRNISATLIMLLLGMTVLLALAALLLNGLIVGLVLRLALDKGLNITHLILGVLPHGIFELPAVFTSAAIGIHIGLQTIKSKGHRIKAASQAIREASAIYLTVVMPLLLLAATIEILISKNLIT